MSHASRVPMDCSMLHAALPCRDTAACPRGPPRWGAPHSHKAPAAAATEQEAAHDALALLQWQWGGIVGSIPTLNC